VNIMECKNKSEMQNVTSSRSHRNSSLAGNECGMVLVLTIVMLALLSILGAMALDASSTDLKIAGNFRNTQEVFYSADAAMAFAINPDTLAQAYAYTTASGKGTKWSQVISIGTITVAANIDYIGSGPLPAGEIYDGDLDVNGHPRFHGLYFAVTTDGTAAHNASLAMESAVVQVVGN
jgi:hypothetical protein